MEHMEPNIAKLRSELTKLQIEIEMVRQMINSLTNAEQGNVEMLQKQANPDTYGPVANLMPIEQQSVHQLEQMKQIGQQLKQQIDHLSSILITKKDKPAPDTTVMSNPGSPALNDPM